MQRCQFVTECAFYNDRLEVMPAESGFLKALYCHKLSQKCQRFKHVDEVSVSDPSNDLLPLSLYVRKPVVK